MYFSKCSSPPPSVTAEAKRGHIAWAQTSLGCVTLGPLSLSILIHEVEEKL